MLASALSSSLSASSSTSLEIDFDPIVITLGWDDTFPGFDLNNYHPLSIDRSELRDLTSQHIVEALQVEFGTTTVVQDLELQVATGIPNYQTRTIPLTLTGQVIFSEPQQALGPASLRRVLLQTSFQNMNAMELYKFRLKIANDPALQQVVSVWAETEEDEEGGREAVTNSSSQNQNQNNNSNNIDNTANPNQQLVDYLNEIDAAAAINTDTSTDEGFVSVLLMAIIGCVGVSILAVLCFIYCLICVPGRSRNSGKAAKMLEENSLVELEDSEIPILVTTAGGGGAGGKKRRSPTTSRYNTSALSPTHLREQSQRFKKKIVAASSPGGGRNSNHRNGRSGRNQNRGGRYASMPEDDHEGYYDDEEYNEDFHDEQGVPAVRTAPTHEMMADEYDIEFNFAAGSHLMLDDGVSAYEMDSTLPPPSTQGDDDEEAASAMLSIMDVDCVEDYQHHHYSNTTHFKTNDDDDDDGDSSDGDKTVASSNVGGGDIDDISEAGTSLYSYAGIADDSSLSASLVMGPYSMGNHDQNQLHPQSPQKKVVEPTNMEKIKKKSILWSVMDSLTVSKAPPAPTSAALDVVNNHDSDDSDNEGTVYTSIDANYYPNQKNTSTSTNPPATTTKTTSKEMLLGPSSSSLDDDDDNNDAIIDNHDSIDDDDSLVYPKQISANEKVNEKEESGTVAAAAALAAIGTSTTTNDPSKSEFLNDKKQEFEHVWTLDTSNAADANLVAPSLQHEELSTPKKNDKNNDGRILQEEEKLEVTLDAPATTKRSNKTVISDNSNDHDIISDNGDGDNVADNDNANSDQEEVDVSVGRTLVESMGLEEEPTGLSEPSPESDVVVDRVPETNATNDIVVDDDKEEDGDEDDRKFLRLPTTLKTKNADTGSKSSSTGIASNNEVLRKGESARTKKKYSTWGASELAQTSNNNSSHNDSSTRSERSCGGSVCSTDSSKLRLLLGQSDTNDAALLFGQHQDSDCGSTDTPESGDVSMHSCTSNQLKSLLLTKSDSKDSADDEDFLFRESAAEGKQLSTHTSSSKNRYITESIEDKNNDDAEDAVDDDIDPQTAVGYLPANMIFRPTTAAAAAALTSPRSIDSGATSEDGSVVTAYSAFSEAPSVDGSITSKMGWF